MPYIIKNYTPIDVFVTPPGGNVSPGSSIKIDTNIPTTIFYTLDGTDIDEKNALSTFRAESPVEFTIYTNMLLSLKAYDRSVEKKLESKTLKYTFIVNRINRMEDFRDTSFFYRKLVKSVVDQNFYLTEGKWVVPTSPKPQNYVFVNREPFPVYLRVLHNGVDVFSTFPVVGIDGYKDVPIVSVSGPNVIEIQTKRSGGTGLYDTALYDVDVYA